MKTLIILRLALAVPFALVLIAQTSARLDVGEVPSNNAALASGFIFTGDYTKQDVVYFQTNLEWLRTVLPEWYQYFMDARPVTFNFDSQVAARGHAAEANCCDESGAGIVRFGYHFGQLDDLTDPSGRSSEARRITFFGHVAHELTHIRDARAGSWTDVPVRRKCLTAELSGLGKQLEIKQDLLRTSLTETSPVAEAYRARLEHQINVETKRLHNRSFLDAYCGNL